MGEDAQQFYDELAGRGGVFLEMREARKMKFINSTIIHKAFVIKLLIAFLIPTVFLPLGGSSLAPVKRVALAFLIYVIFAIGTSNNIKDIFVNDDFWVGLFRKETLHIVIISGCYLLLYAILNFFMWGADNLPAAIYKLWWNMDLPIGAGLIICSIVLGTKVGWRFDSTQPTEETSSIKKRQIPGWLITSTGETRKIWFWLAIIGVLPTLITLIIVIESLNQRGLFYPVMDHSYIDDVEWMSDHEITFRLVSFFITDCVGCGYDHYNFIVNVDNKEIALSDNTYFSSGWPETRVFEGSVISPDQSRIIYVDNRYDLYVKKLGGKLFSTCRVFRYPGLNFFERHYEKLVSSLISSLLVGIMLVFPYFYVNRVKIVFKRGFTAIVVWNVLWFVGSIIVVDLRLLDIQSYLWRAIP